MGLLKCYTMGDAEPTRQVHVRKHLENTQQRLFPSEGKKRNVVYYHLKPFVATCL